MTGHHTISPRAQNDLDDIWPYTVKRWGLDQAAFYIRRIGLDIATVAEQPMMERICSEVRARLIEGGVDVVRILHEQMDCMRHV